MDSPLHEAPKKIVLGGAVRQLSFEHADFAVAERKLGRPLLGPRGLVEFWAPACQADMLSTLLFVGICRRYPKYSPEDVAEWIDYENEDEVNDLIVTEAKPILDRIRARIERAMAAAKAAEEAGQQQEAEGEPAAPLANETGGVISDASPVSTSD